MSFSLPLRPHHGTLTQVTDGPRPSETTVQVRAESFASVFARPRVTPRR
jgi:hypothetical protein